MEEHIRLPAGESAVPGPIRLWGYQRGVADAIGDPLIERVTVIKSARIGYTTLLVGALANYVHNDPSSLLCLRRPGVARAPAATASSEVETNLKLVVSSCEAGFLSFLRGFWTIFDPRLHET
jgi:phage terminase large subunit GpA-like protein